MIEKTNTSKVEMHNVVGLICGPSGAGKTYSIGTLPEEETLIIAIDPGLLTLKGRNYEVWNITSADDLKQAYSDLKKDNKFKYVCIDSLTELAEILFSSLKPSFTKSQTFALYDAFSTNMIEMIKAFRGLTQYHVFMTALMKDSDSGPIIDVGQKSLSYRLPSYFDITMMVKTLTKGDEVKRFLVTDNSVHDFLKSRSNNIEAYEEVNLTDVVRKAMS